MDPLESQISALHADGRVRVWSLVTTVFGDAVLHRGGRIYTSQLLELMARIRIESGAVRTALSRLAGDGWIIGARDGRKSRYRLTEIGRRETELASASIYRGPSPDPQVWSILLTSTAPKDALSLGGHAYLVPGDAKNGIAVTGKLAAGHELISERALSEPHRRALVALDLDLKGLSLEEMLPLDAMAARILLIHRWRRIVLRYPEIPAGLLPPDLRDMRSVLSSVYPQLFEISETWIDAPKASGKPERFQMVE